MKKIETTAETECKSLLKSTICQQYLDQIQQLKWYQFTAKKQVNKWFDAELKKYEFMIG